MLRKPLMFSLSGYIIKHLGKLKLYKTYKFRTINYLRSHGKTFIYMFYRVQEISKH